MANTLLTLSVTQIDNTTLPTVDSRGISSDRIKIVIDRGADRLIRVYDPKRKVNTEYIVTDSFSSIKSDSVDLIEVTLISIEGVSNISSALINAEDSIKSARDIATGNEVIYNFGDYNNQINQTLIIQEDVATLQALIAATIPIPAAAGPNTSVQFNNNGVLDGNLDLTTDGTGGMSVATITGSGTNGLLDLRGVQGGTIGGDVSIQGGFGLTTPGKVNITAGATNSIGESVTIKGGDGPTGQSGSVFIQGGTSGDDNGIGGDIILQGGQGGVLTGKGGDIDVFAGDSEGTSQAPGIINIKGGQRIGFSERGHLILQDTGGSVGIGTSTPNASSLLDIFSTTHGFLGPRMTTAQVDAIVSPEKGLEVYDLTLSVKKQFDGFVWKPVPVILNLERTITQFSDWADTTSPGGGCVVTASDITYEANFTYKVSGGQLIGDRGFIINGKNFMYGTSNSDSVTRTGTGPMFTLVSGDTFFFNLMKVNGSGTATLWSAVGDSTQATQLIPVASEISDFASLGTVNNMGIFRHDSNIFAGIDDGVTVSGTGVLHDWINNVVTLDAGTLIDLGTSVYSSFTFRGQDIAVALGTSTMISGATGSANIAVGGFGQVLNNVFQGPGDYLSGITNDDERWNFKGNAGGKGTEDSKVVGSIVMENNTTVTTITDIGETFMVTAYADAGGGSTEVTTSVVHGLSNGTDVWIVGTVAYDGQFVTANVTASTFDIVVAFVTDEAIGTAETGWEIILGTTTANITRRISQSANSQMTFNNLQRSDSNIDALCGVLLDGGGSRQVQTGIFQNNARCFGSLGNITTSTNIVSAHSKCLRSAIDTDIFDVRVRNLETTANVIVQNETFTANE